MSGRKRRDIPRPLASGRDRFQNWRRGRRRGTRIPERLWKLAVKLAESHGLNRTASVLQLDYYALKKRVESMNSQTRSVTPAFVELAPPELASSNECIVEFEDGSGAQLRVHMKGCQAPDLLALSRSFWNDR